MTGYLQRLFDRGAGLASGGLQGEPGQPAMRPGSPLAQIDQRLGARELASDFTFGIGFDAGAEPDPDLLDGSDAPLAASRNLPQPLPPLPARQSAPPDRDAPRQADRAPEPRLRQRELRETPPDQAKARAQNPLSPPERVLRPPLLEPPADRAQLEPPAISPPGPAPLSAAHVKPAGAVGDPEPAERTKAVPASPNRAEGRLRSVPEPAPRPAEPPLARASDPKPVAVPVDPDRPLPAAQPARSGAEPPALPVPEPIDWREVDRRIAAAMERKEQTNAAQPEVQAQSGPSDLVEQARPAQSAPAYKTAAESSIIGPIETASRPRTLFGERLR